MRFVAKNGNFSANNLGNSFNANIIFQLAGITNTNKKNALLNFENSLRESGLWDYFDVLRVMGFGSALADSFNLKNPGLGAGYNQGVFLADDPLAHTQDGYQPAPTTRYMNSNYTVPTDLTNFHIHAYNTSADANGASGSGLVGKKDTNSPANYDIILSRSYGNRTKFAIGNGTSQDSIFAVVGYDRTKTGLLSGWKIGNDRKMADSGVVIAAATGTVVPVGGGIKTLNEGAYGVDDGFFTSSAKIRFIAYGHTAWDETKESLLTTIVNQFNADMLL